MALPLSIGCAKQLFIDRRFVEAADGIELCVNPPVRSGIVLRGEQPWEVVGAYVTVIDDGAKVRAYYNTHVHGDGMKAGRLCYAESKDGVHFRKPELGLVEWEGSAANNIVFPDVLDAVPFIDPVAPPEERWKLLYNFGRPGQPQVRDPAVAGVYLASSPDGLRWTPGTTRLIPLIAETPKIALWDPDRRKYVVFLRALDPQRTRAIGRIEMDDISQPWPHRPNVTVEKWRNYVTSAAVPMVLSTDEDDPPESDFYVSAYVRYPFAADVHLMFPPIYRHTPPPVGVDKNDGPLATQLACSRDGITWFRPDRRPYIRPGLSSEFDRGYNMLATGLVRREDWLYQYYTAKGGTHHGRTDDLSPAAKAELGKGCLVMVKQRLDGFVSADAAYSGGSLTTPPLVFTGNRLELNLDTEAAGSAAVELLDEAGRPVPGFAAADCDSIAGNFTAHTVTWRGQSDLPSRTNQPTRLRFRMRSTKLYAFQFCGR